MLTKNYYETVYALHKNAGVNLVTTSGGSSSGVLISHLYSSSDASFPLCIAMVRCHSDYGVRFGTGSTKPTVDDYKMEEIISSGITVVCPGSVSRSKTPLYEEVAVTYGVTATKDVTIREIGVYCQAGAGASYAKTVYLADRTVLETPITLAAGESKQITYAIRFNYPVS